MRAMASDRDLAQRAVRAGAAAAQGMAGGELDVRRKTSPADLVSAADHASEEAIVALLRAERPNDAIVGEEGASVGAGSRRWLVDGLDGTVKESALRALERHPRISSVYSIGGGNRAILEAFDEADRTCRVFLGHDLDRDNLQLLREERLTAVLHHDLRYDMRRACQVIMQAQGAIDGPIESVRSPIHIVTPHNIALLPG